MLLFTGWCNSERTGRAHSVPLISSRSRLESPFPSALSLPPCVCPYRNQVVQGGV